jgi:hypothetical protein
MPVPARGAVTDGDGRWVRRGPAWPDPVSVAQGLAGRFIWHDVGWAATYESRRDSVFQP